MIEGQSEMKQLAIAGQFCALGLALGLAATQANGRANAGGQQPEASLPFTMTQVTTLSFPWRIAFLPDSRMLITEKSGGMQLVTPQGQKTPVSNGPDSYLKAQAGMLGVYLSPHYAKDHFVYLTYSEPGEGGSSRALARAKLALKDQTASLEDLKVIWRDGA